MDTAAKSEVSGIYGGVDIYNSSETTYLVSAARQRLSRCFHAWQRGVSLKRHGGGRDTQMSAGFVRHASRLTRHSRVLCIELKAKVNASST